MRRRGTASLLTLVLVAGIGLAAGTACREPGPAEKAGKAIDDAVDEARDEAEKAKEKVSEALE